MKKTFSRPPIKPKGDEITKVAVDYPDEFLGCTTIKPISQADIDRPDNRYVQAWNKAYPSIWRRLWNWLNGVSKWALTVIVLVCFLAGAYAFFAVWVMRQTIVSTAGRG